MGIVGAVSLKNRQIWAIACAFVISALPIRAVAQNSGQQENRVWTKQSLVAFAIANNPEMKLIRRQRGIADAAIVSSEAIPNPTVKLEWLHANDSSVSEMGWGVGLQWTPPQPTQWSALQDRARARRSELDESIVESENDLAASVQSAWVTADELGEQIVVVERSIALRGQILKALQERLSQGASTRLEVNMASLSLLRAEQERDGIILHRQTVLRGLAGLAGLPVGQAIAIEPTENREDLSEFSERGNLQQRALERRALLRADAARAEAADHQLRAERTKQWPWISLSALPRYRHNETSTRADDISFGLDVSIPIFDRNKGGIAAAEAERGKEAETRTSHEAQIRRDVVMAESEMRGRRELLIRYRATMDPVFREHQMMMQMVLANHQVDIVALLTAEDAIVRSQRELSEMRLSYRKAQIQLSRAVGADRRAL